MHVQSGSERHQFRRFHEALGLVKHVKYPHRSELYASLEPVRIKITFSAFLILLIGQRVQDACIKTCQEWFIAVYIGNHYCVLPV
jgi:hypothetical protein